MAHLPLRREALIHLNQTANRQQKRGREVLDQMFAYFSYSDLPFVAAEETTGYDHAA